MSPPTSRSSTRAQAGDPRRGELAGAGVRLGGRHPYFVARAEGAHVWDVEGRRYVDYVQSYGASILGHAHPGWSRRCSRPRRDGSTYGAPTEREVHGRGPVRRVAGLEMVRLVSSGHRGGHVGAAPGPGRHRPRQGREVRRVLPRHERPAAGRGRQRRGQPGPGRLGRREPGSGGRHGGRALQRVPELDGTVAAVVVEPVAANMGLVPPAPGLPRGAAGGVRPGGRAADLRRGHHRLPARPGWRRGCTACAPTCGASARSSAAACPWPPSAAGAT
jgi:hypothetical protein